MINMQYLNATYIIFNFKLFVSSWMFFLGFGVAPIPFSLIDVWFQSGQTKQLVNSLGFKDWLWVRADQVQSHLNHQHTRNGVLSIYKSSWLPINNSTFLKLLRKLFEF